MKTVHEVSRLSGVSVRTLHHYDKIGLLKPAQVTDAGYRLYGEYELERLQSILIFKELKFSLKDIKEIMKSTMYDRTKILDHQIELLKLQKEHLEKLINYACEIKKIGVNDLSFKAFDTSKMDEYAKEAKTKWGGTEAYKEFEKKNEGRSASDNNMIGEVLMQLFVELGKVKHLDPASDEAQTAVKKIQNFITEHYYTCTDEIFRGLGQMYACGGEMTDNIDKAGGIGTAEFAKNAIEILCRK